MAALVPFPLEQPGVAGLNKEGRNTVLGPEWATVLNNFVIDSEGRLALRAGTKGIDDTAITGSLVTLWTMRTKAGAVQTYGFTDAETMITLSASGGTKWDSGSLFASSGDGNVQFCNVAGLAHMVDPTVGKVYREATYGAGFFQVATAATNPLAIAGIYGRLFVLTRDAVYVSEDPLITNALYDKVVDLPIAFGEGGDEPVAIAEFNGNLVIFGKNNTVIYADPVDPASATGGFEKVETLLGVGCVNRDTVQNIGTDILFLSNLGLRSLSRTIQEKSNPITDSAPQVRDYVLDAALAATPARIKSAFVSRLGLYILTLDGTTLVVDTRRPLPNGALRVMEWDKKFSAPAYDSDNGLLLAIEDTVYRYGGLLDEVPLTTTVGNTITGDYEGGWLDFGNAVEGAGPLVKYLKQMRVAMVGGNDASLTAKWSTSFLTAVQSSLVQLPERPGASTFGGGSNFGGTSFFGKTKAVLNRSFGLSRSGRVVKIGLLVQNSTSAFAINRIDVFAKVGKLFTR